MSDLKDLYQEVILDHYKKPHNFHKLEAANRKAEGHNPLCGDHVIVYLDEKDGVIRDIGFQGSGCAISRASASMMTDSLKGKTKTEASVLFKKFQEMVTSDYQAPTVAPELEKLEVFSGVCEFPARVKCAILAWHTLLSALEGEGKTVSTEKEEEKPDGTVCH
jgi:nitrogen fixation NifU-like protein